MSGPLASWVLAHTKAAHPAERFVLAALALRCNHDGIGEATGAQLEADTGHDERTVRAALAEAIKRKELERPKRGGRGAAGYPSGYQFATPRCVEGADCPTCASLTKARETASQTRLGGGRRQPTGSQTRLETQPTGSQTRPTGSETRPYGNGEGTYSPPSPSLPVSATHPSREETKQTAQKGRARRTGRPPKALRPPDDPRVLAEVERIRHEDGARAAAAYQRTVEVNWNRKRAGDAIADELGRGIGEMP